MGSEKDDPFDTFDTFDSETLEYRAFFPEASRDEAAFRLTRVLAISARQWGTHVESLMLAKPVSPLALADSFRTLRREASDHHVAPVGTPCHSVAPVDQDAPFAGIRWSDSTVCQST